MNNLETEVKGNLSTAPDSKVLERRYDIAMLIVDALNAQNEDELNKRRPVMDKIRKECETREIKK